MKSKTQSSVGPKMLMSVAVTLLLAGQTQAVNQEQNQQVNVQQLSQDKSNLDLDKKNKHFKKNMKLFVQLDNKKIHESFNYEVDPSTNSVVEISEEKPNGARAEGVLDDIAESTPSKTTISSMPANAAAVKTTYLPAAVQAPVINAPLENIANSAPAKVAAPVINAPLESVSIPATAASVRTAVLPAAASPAPVINAPLESVANNAAPATAVTIAPTVPVVSAPASDSSQDDGRAGPPIAQNATHEVVPVKEIEEKEVTKVDPITNAVKTEIVKMEVIKNKAVEKGVKISKDGSETKTQVVGDEIVTVKKKKKSAVKEAAKKVAEAKEAKKEIEITTNDDDTDDEVVKKIEEKIGKKLKPSQKKKAIQVVKLKKQVIKMNKEDEEKGTGPGGSGGDIDEDIAKKDDKSEEPEIKIDKDGNVNLKPKESKEEKDEKDQEEKDEAEVKEVLKANAIKEAKKTTIKAAGPKKEVKKVGAPIAQNSTHEVVPVVIDVPKVQADGTVAMEKVVKNKAIPKEKPAEVVGAPIAQNTTHEVVPVVVEVNKEQEDGSVVTEKVVKNKAMPKKVPVASPVPLAAEPAAASAPAGTPVSAPVAQNSTHEVVPTIEEEVKDVPKVQADGTVKVEKQIEKVVKNKVVAKPVTIPATAGAKASEPLPVKIPNKVEDDEKDCDKTEDVKPAPKAPAPVPVAVPKKPEAPIDATKEPCKACKKKNHDAKAKLEGAKPCARCAKKKAAEKAAKAKADALNAANEERDFPCKVCDRQKKKEAEETIPVAVNATHTTVPVVEEEIKEVTIKNETTGKEETTLEKVPVVKQKVVAKQAPVAQNTTHEVVPVVEEEEQTVPEANPVTGKTELKTKKVQVVKNKVIPKVAGAAAATPAIVAPAALPVPVVNAPLEDLEKAPVDPKSAAIGAANGAKQDVAPTVVVAPTTVSAPLAASPAPLVNAPLEDLEKAPVDPKSAAIGAASGAKEDVPSVPTPAVTVAPATQAVAPLEEDSIEAPIKPKVVKKQVVEEEEQEITRTDKKTGKTTVEVVKTPVVVEKTIVVPKQEKVQKPDIDEEESPATEKKKENYLDDLEANLKEAFARIHKQKSDLKTKKILKRIGKESPETAGQSEGFKEATKVVEDQELKEAESALKNVDVQSIDAKASAKSIVGSESLHQAALGGVKGKLHANFQNLMQVQTKYNTALGQISEEMDQFSTSLNANHLYQALFLQNQLKEDKSFLAQGMTAPQLSVHTVKAFNNGFSFPQIALNDFAASQIQVLKSGEEQLNQGLAEGNKDDVSAFIDLANLTSQNLKAKYGDQWNLAETKKEEPKEETLETDTQAEKVSQPEKIQQPIAVVQKKAIANLQAKIDQGQKIDVDADTFKEINDSIVESTETEKYDANGIEEVVA